MATRLSEDFPQLLLHPGAGGGRPDPRRAPGEDHLNGCRLSLCRVAVFLQQTSFFGTSWQSVFKPMPVTNQDTE